MCRQQEIEKELAAEQHKMELQTQIKLVEEVQYMREQVRMKLEEHDELVTEDREERSEEEII